MITSPSNIDPLAPADFTNNDLSVGGMWVCVVAIFIYAAFLFALGLRLILWLHP